MPVKITYIDESQHFACGTERLMGDGCFNEYQTFWKWAVKFYLSIFYVSHSSEKLYVFVFLPTAVFRHLLKTE